ncbi:MAG: hypothetical protein IIC55_10895 [Proteobacteria bacterium]|nr:hypothetical protein [Pseudomonadota bacterium]
MIPAKKSPEADNGPRSVTILGSTGSVGSNTVELIENNLDDFVVEALTANRNVKLLAEQALRLKPQTAVLADPEGYGELKDALAGSDVAVAAGPEAVILFERPVRINRERPRCRDSRLYACSVGSPAINNQLPWLDVRDWAGGIEFRVPLFRKC